MACIPFLSKRIILSMNRAGWNACFSRENSNSTEFTDLKFLIYSKFWSCQKLKLFHNVQVLKEFIQYSKWSHFRTQPTRLNWVQEYTLSSKNIVFYISVFSIQVTSKGIIITFIKSFNAFQSVKYISYSEKLESLVRSL